MEKKLKISLYPNLTKPNAIQCATDACKMLKILGAEFCDFDTDAIQADVILVVGGDGTILRCAKRIIKTDLRILGINTGYLGFMSSLEYNELNLLKRLFVNDYTVSKRMLLKVILKNREGERKFRALNDIYIRNSNFSISDFQVNIVGPSDSVSAVGDYRADGIIFSTPTGSTAHSLSAGGPVIEPDLECIEMNIICSHSLFNRPVIFAAHRTLQLKFPADGSQLSVDGEPAIELKQGDEIYVSRANSTVSIIDVKGDSFHNSLNNKLTKSIKESA